MECALALTLSLVALIFSVISVSKDKSPRIKQKMPKKSRKRYVMVLVISEGRVDRSKLEEAIRDEFVKSFGELNLALSGLKLVYFDEAVNVGVVRIAYEYKRHLLVALSKVRRVDGEKVVLVPLKSFGTIKSAVKRIPKLPSNIVKR